MIWYLTYFGLALTLFIILWINLFRNGEFLENTTIKVISILIILPFFAIFFWKTSEFAIQPVFDFLNKPKHISEITIENNTNKSQEFVFFVRRAKMEHWKPVYARNNFSLDWDAFSAIEKIQQGKSTKFKFSPNNGKYDRLLVVRLENKMNFKTKAIQAIAVELSGQAVKIYSDEFDSSIVKTIKPNLDFQILMLSMFFVAIIVFLYNMFIKFESLVFRIIFAFLNLILAGISGYLAYIFTKYFLLFI